MYVCICKGITEQQVRATVEAGAASVKDLYRQLELGSQCGKCVMFAREIVTHQQSACAYYNAASI